MSDNENSKDILSNKKVNLLSFQKYLNEKFNENSINNEILLEKQREELGLADEIANLIFLFPLKDLRKISNDNKMEEISLIKNWILGFNQLQGEVYTIINLEKIIELLIGKEYLKKEDLLTLNKYESYINLANTDSILYLKNINDNRFGIILKNLVLGNTNKFKDIFDENIENIKEKLNKEELTVLEQYMLKDVKENENEDFDLIEGNKYNIIDLINNVYFDDTLNRPVFSINIDKLIILLISLSPF